MQRGACRLDHVRIAIVREGIAPAKEVDMVVFAGVSLEAIRAREASTFVAAAQQYARAHQVHVVPGLYVEDDALRSCLIAPDGELIGVQHATHVHRTHFPDVKRDTDLLFLSTPWGFPVFLAVDVDIYKPELLRIAARAGVKLVIAHQYIEPARANVAMIDAGAWQQAQQNCIYVAQTSNMGSHLIAPCQITRDLSGYVATCGVGEDVYGVYRPAELAIAYQAFRVFDSLNPPLYTRYAAQLLK